MEKFFTATIKICLIFLAIACNDSLEEPKANQLLDYWNRKVTLTLEEQKELALANTVSGNPYIKAIAQYITGNFSKMDGDYTNAIMHYLQAEHELSKSGMIDDKLLGHIYRNKGSVSRKFALYQQAVNYYDSALSHYNHYPEDFVSERLATLYNRGLALRYVNSEQALKHLKVLHEETKRLANISFELRTLTLIGEVYINMTNYKEAERYIIDAIKLFERTDFNNQSIEAQLYKSLSRVYYYMGDFTKQETYLRLSLGVGLERKAFSLSVDLGESLIEQGKKQEAFALLTDLEVDYAQQVLHPDHIRIYELLAKVSKSSARMSYLDKEREERAKYDQEKETMVTQAANEKLQLMAKQVAFQNNLAEEKAAAKRRFISTILISLLIIGLVAAVSIFRYQRLKRLTIETVETTVDLSTKLLAYREKYEFRPTFDPVSGGTMTKEIEKFNYLKELHDKRHEDLINSYLLKEAQKEAEAKKKKGQKGEGNNNKDDKGN